MFSLIGSRESWKNDLTLHRTQLDMQNVYVRLHCSAPVFIQFETYLSYSLTGWWDNLQETLEHGAKHQRSLQTLSAFDLIWTSPRTHLHVPSMIIFSWLGFPLEIYHLCGLLWKWPICRFFNSSPARYSARLNRNSNNNRYSYFNSSRLKFC